MSQSVDRKSTQTKDSTKFDFRQYVNRSVSAAIRNNLPEDTSKPVHGFSFWEKHKVETKKIRVVHSFACLSDKQCDIIAGVAECKDADKLAKIAAILNEGRDKPVSFSFARPSRKE